MKTVVLAYHNIGCVGIRALIDQGFDIQAIFSHKDDPKENIWFESVADVAAINDIPVYTPSDINHPLWVERIKEMQPEIIFSFYYRDMIKKEIIDIPSVGCFNLHGSLLPRYRGRCPVNWVLINGEKETGVTLHKMTPNPDDGGILGHEYVAIDNDDTALILHKKLAHASGVLLKKMLPWIKKNKINPVAQNQSEASYFGGRKPDDGKIDWNQSVSVIYNLVRALTRPYPGAFSFLGNTRCLFWEVKKTEALQQAIPGTILSTNPLTIACKDNALEVLFGQTTEGVYINGNQLVREMNLTDGMCFSNQKEIVLRRQEKKRVLILGANGFIGNHLSERLLESGHYEVYGMDLHSNTLEHLKDHPDFNFKEGDISIMHEWIEYHVEKCDVILPLVAIATPKEYVRNPLRVFELDFEENLRIVRYCAKYGKRLIFPSTSEVYGMCQDDEFDEENSNFIQGPIHKQRWIYSCSKQMLDRVIWAYGATRGLEFTLIRPFNWVGPKLDTLDSARIGSSRVITQFILNLVEGTPIQLVDGGKQKRCFTDVKDGVECLFKIIENKNNICNSRIFNIGNPDNEYSMEELADILREQFADHPLRSHFPPDAGVKSIEAKTYYGSGYQDVQHRRPSIKQARKLLNWNPNVPFEQSVGETLDYFLQDLINNQERKSWQMLDCA